MSDEQRAREEEVFDQELSLDDLDAAAGGDDGAESVANGLKLILGGDKDADRQNCTNHDYRQMYGGNGFPNCAATVEDGSHCARNDACYSKAVDYQGLKDCAKAWR